MENTPRDHPDHSHLVQAEGAIHNLALKINSVKESKQSEDVQETLKKLELLLITDVSKQSICDIAVSFFRTAIDAFQVRGLC